MNIRSLTPVSLMGAGLLSFSCTGTDSTEQESGNQTGPVPEKPNIIILFADDLGYGDLACYGHPVIRTPHLDRMAAEGVRLTQFYSAAPLSTPSRAALLTGRYPVRTGLASDSHPVLFPDDTIGIPASEVTLGERLQEQGYATACIGKWHLGHLTPFLPTQNGFDYYYGIPYSNDMSGATHPDPSFERFPPIPLMRGNEIIEEEPDQATLTQRYTDEALKFIDQHKEGPFFLYLPYTMPHTPLAASAGYKGTSPRGLYGDVVSELDHSVGRIMDKLKELGIEGNTLVFFTSDNGPWLGQEQDGGSAGLLREGKGTIWEGGWRVPAIAWWPGVLEAGKIVQGIATTMDLNVSCQRLAGANTDNGPTLDGVDMMPLLRGESDEIREHFIYYQYETIRAVRYNQYKMIIDYETDSTGATVAFVNEFYHIENDPSEKNMVNRKWTEIAFPFAIEKALEYVEEYQSINEK